MTAGQVQPNEGRLKGADSSTMMLEIARRMLWIEWPEQTPSQWPPSWFGRFEVLAHGDPHASLHIRLDPDLTADGALGFANHDALLSPRDVGSIVRRCANQVMRYYPSEARLEIGVRPGHNPQKYYTALVAYLLHCLLVSARGLLMHGAGFTIDALGAVVTGPSGAGKSAAMSLIRPDSVLSDDAVAVTIDDCVPTAHSTPVGGRTDGRGSSPLCALFLPLKSNRFSVRRLRPREAFVQFWGDHGNQVSRLFPVMRNGAFNAAYDLFQRVPAYELAFSLDGIDRDAIRAVMENPPPLPDGS